MLGMHIHGKSMKKLRGMIDKYTIPGRVSLWGEGAAMDDGRGFSHIGKVLFLDLGCRYTDVFFVTFF